MIYGRGLDAVNRRSLRELAYINVGMSGSYAGLEALGGEDALNWNQEGFYQVAKIPLLFLSAIGSGSLAGRVGRSQSSNVVKRFEHGQGTVKPSLWGYRQPDKKATRKRKRS